MSNYFHVCKKSKCSWQTFLKVLCCRRNDSFTKGMFILCSIIYYIHFFFRFFNVCMSNSNDVYQEKRREVFFWLSHWFIYLIRLLCVVFDSRIDQSVTGDLSCGEDRICLQVNRLSSEETITAHLVPRKPFCLNPEANISLAGEVLVSLTRTRV